MKLPLILAIFVFSIFSNFLIKAPKDEPNSTDSTDSRYLSSQQNSAPSAPPLAENLTLNFIPSDYSGEQQDIELEEIPETEEEKPKLTLNQIIEKYKSLKSCVTCLQNLTNNSYYNIEYSKGIIEIAAIEFNSKEQNEEKDDFVNFALQTAFNILETTANLEIAAKLERFEKLETTPNLETTEKLEIAANNTNSSFIILKCAENILKIAEFYQEENQKKYIHVAINLFKNSLNNINSSFIFFKCAENFLKIVKFYEEKSTERYDLTMMALNMFEKIKTNQQFEPNKELDYLYMYKASQAILDIAKNAKNFEKERRNDLLELGFDLESNSAFIRQELQNWLKNILGIRDPKKINYINRSIFEINFPNNKLASQQNSAPASSDLNMREEKPIRSYSKLFESNFGNQNLTLQNPQKSFNFLT